MTPKEKANELIQKYTVATWIKMEEIKYLTTIPSARECAIIAVDEIIESYKTKDLIYPKEVIYYQKVKQEIEKL